MTLNFDDLNYREQYEILERAKDLLAYLYDVCDDFPMESYMSGSKGLQDAMSFVDNKLLELD